MKKRNINKIAIILSILLVLSVFAAGVSAKQKTSSETYYLQGKEFFDKKRFDKAIDNI